MSPIKEKRLAEHLKTEVERWFIKYGGKHLCFPLPSYASLTMIDAVIKQQKEKRNLYAKIRDCFGKGRCIHFSDGSHHLLNAGVTSYIQRTSATMASMGWR